MEYYKHYSFDLWLTLIKSNPEFKKERANFFYKEYNFCNKTINEIELIFRKVDNLSNAINEKTGGNITCEEMYLQVISQINNETIDFSKINIFNLYDQCEQIFFNYSPVLIIENTKQILTTLKTKTNSKFNILSNTAFIKGSTLRKLLSNLEIADLFEFQLYSDEENYSKPNMKFFEILFTKINKSQLVFKNEIIHIGDNLNADINGAMNFGIHAFQINSNSNTLIDIL